MALSCLEPLLHKVHPVTLATPRLIAVDGKERVDVLLFPWFRSYHTSSFVLSGTPFPSFLVIVFDELSFNCFECHEEW